MRADDADIERLLHEVYVGEGYTPADVAAAAFRAGAVRARGELIVEHDDAGRLAGMIIVAAPGSPARRIAGPDEAEMHLLAVAAIQRGRGVGGRLVAAAVASGRALGVRRMVLWTQPSMTAARRLYEAAGFVREPARDAQIALATGRSFLVYVRELRGDVSDTT